MKQSAPEIRHLATQLLALEARENEQGAGAGARAALAAFAKLHTHLTKLIGIAGLQAILSRAVALVRQETRWLEEVRVAPNATFAGLSEAAERQTEDAAVRGCAALLAQLLDLLVTFIGEALTLRIVQDVWPKAPLDTLISGAEETPE